MCDGRSLHLSKAGGMTVNSPGDSDERDLCSCTGMFLQVVSTIFMRRKCGMSFGRISSPMPSDSSPRGYDAKDTVEIFDHLLNTASCIYEITI